MTNDHLLRWLLDGDVSVQYQARRDLLDQDQGRLRERIAREGWGAKLLFFRRSDGHWGQAYYRPKWTSTHYTLLDLKNLAISPTTRSIQQTLGVVPKAEKGADGGINPFAAIRQSDVCMNGMFLNVASYFQADQRESREFILRHRLFRSDRSGQVIDRKMLMLSYPSRWPYDILRALDYFRTAGAPYDPRMGEALVVLSKKRRPEGTWPLQARHPGQTHFEMETVGEPSRWNTLRALRVRRHFGLEPH